jgi:hypothetical protein
VTYSILTSMQPRCSMSAFLQKYKTGLLAFGIGMIVGVLFVGPLNVMPWNINWLYGKGDGSANQLVFQFFRQTPFLQWPITAIPNYVVGANTVNPDGNAIFAVGAKFVGLFFRGQFQYFGVLIVLWFALQAFFAERLLSRFIENGNIRLMGMTFFVIAPAFVYRLGSMGHFHVAAHWLILAAFYLYFDSNFRRLNWSILLAIAVAINIYIAAIVVPIFIASVGRTVLERKHVRLRKAMCGIAELTVSPMIAAAASFIISGYASYSNSAVGSGFYRLNIFAFMNPGYSPSGSFSLFTNTVVPSSSRYLFAEEWEGFQYIGFGVVLLLPIFFLFILRSRQHFLKSSWMPISVVSILLFVFSLSNQIVFSNLRFNYWWPSALLQLHQIFRGASRFGFALYYLVTLGAIVSVSRLFTKKAATILLGLLLTLAVVDQSSGLWQSHRDLSVKVSSEIELRDADWNLIAKGHSRLVVDKNFDFQVEGAVPDSARIFSDNWFSLASFAADHQMSTNFGYVSRPIQSFVRAEDARVAAELTSGNLDSEAIYLISNEEDWNRYKNLVGNNGRGLILDGFYVIVGQ